ncbi:unnamed protein product [Discula destructiva]
MAPKLSEDEIDDLIYFARAGEVPELNETLASFSTREAVSPADILTAAKDSGKSTCLHMATGNGNLELVTALLSHFSAASKELKQTFLDACNEFGNTGLHWAAMGGHLEVVKFLVAEGASTAIANDKNYIPLDLASFAEKMNVVDYFLDQMEDLEGENGGEGLRMAAGSMELSGEKDSAETEKGKEAKDGQPGASS